jgi:HK97 family phage major capsid protein
MPKYTVSQAQKLVEDLGVEAAKKVLAHAQVVDDTTGEPVEFVVKSMPIKNDNAPATLSDSQIALITKGVTDQLRGQLPEGGPSARITGGEFRNDDNKTFGWAHIGEMASHVVKSIKSGEITDDRLRTKAGNVTEILKKAALSTYANEGVGAEGGFPIAPDFAEQIESQISPPDSISALCNELKTNRNTKVVTDDESTPWGSDGIQANWEGEAEAAGQSKPSLKQKVIKLNKITALVPITDEDAEDAPYLLTHINQKAPEVINFKLDLGIINGTGAGQPLGVVNAPGTVSIAKVGSQAAGSIVAVNLINMMKALYAKNRAKAVWVASQSTEDMLQFLFKIGKLDTGAADTGWGVNVPIFSYDQNGNARLMGKPVIFHEACSDAGTKGDIILGDFSKYNLLKKTTGLQMATSMHLWFDQQATALRFVYRVAGQPALKSQIAARTGNAKYSPFVTLDTRG